jgi:large subunit ribosomal protein L34e
MVAGRHKSNSMRKVKVRTPGGKTVERYTLKKPGRAVCPMTGQYLHGVPHLRPTKLRNTPKTKRVPTRAYGGVLSSKAARAVVKFRARSEE